MTTPPDHSAQVDAWMQRAGASDLSAEQLVRALEEACGALWQRALVTLGDVTLAALFDRVLCYAAERFSFLSGVQVETTGPRFDPLREQALSVPREQLGLGVRFVLVELLTVIGSLTAEILSPALHAALAKVPAAPTRAAQDTPLSHPGHVAREGGQ